MIRAALSAIMLAAPAVVLAQTQPAACYDWIAHEKFRGGYLSSADLGEGIARMGQVGMNAVMPKFGGLQAPPTEANVERLRAWGEAARAADLHLLPVFNFRGGETEALLGERREVTIAGYTMERTPCPLDEAFWSRYILGRALFLAEHAQELGLTGAIIDPEMYGADHTGFSGACYCADCLREFLEAADQPVPDPFPEPDQRAAWLEEHGLTAQFQQRFVDRVREFSAQIEQQCHAANPDFLLGVFLLDYPIPFHRAMAMGLGTPTHPVLGFSETTYSTGFTDYVLAQQQTFAQMPAHVLFVPGLWQQQFPSENLAEQYYACAANSAGYWIYTFESLLEDVSRLPGYQLREPDERYWEAMALANGELDQLMASGGTYESTLTVRPFDPPLPVLATGDIEIPALMAAPDAEPLSMGPITTPRLRYRNPLFILCTAAEPVAVRVTNVQLANYLPGTGWAVVAPDGTRLVEDHMKVRESTDVEFTPEQDGVYLLVVSSGQNAHTLTMLTNQPCAFSASEQHPLIANGSLGRMYFYVPPGVTGFSVFAKAEGQAAGRGGKLTAYAPDGTPVAHIEGDLGVLTEMPVTVPEGADGRVWCLSAEELSNDLRVYLSPEVPPYLSPDPARVVTAAP